MYIYNKYINKIKNTKTKIHKTAIRCKASVTPEMKLNEDQLQNLWVTMSEVFLFINETERT